MSPWFKLYGHNPDIFSLKVFGCACYPYLRPYSHHKLNHRTAECIFLGYSNVSKGYLCLDLVTHKLYTCRHVLFNEHKFPFPLTSNSVPPSHSLYPDLWLSNLLYLHSSNQPSILGPYPSNSFSFPTHISTPASSFTSPSVLPTPSSLFHPQSQCPSPTSQPTASPIISHPTASPTITQPPLPQNTSTLNSNQAPANFHPMTTRSKNGITKPKLCFKAVLDYTHTEPPSYKVASKFPQWVQAMDDEFSALQRQKTWSLIPAHSGINLVGCKWV